MSTRYPGGVITKTPVVPAGPYETGAAPGIWTLDQQLQAQKAGIWPLAGNVPNYIEDVFSTYLYTGTGASLTITNGIDLSTKGGLVWSKNRSALTGAFTGFDRHVLFDNIRTGATGGGAGGGGVLRTNAAALDDATITYLSSYNSNGYTIASNATISNAEFINQSGTTFASWTFREQPKFFDVVAYTGTGSNTTIAHNLGSVPGMIIVKRTDTTGDWQCYHRSLANTQYMVLNTTAAVATGATRWNSTTPTSSVFSLGTDATVNASAGTYVAYIFAHDAGGFGLTGTDNVISCGSYTTNASAKATINLGYEAQWVLVKRSSGADGWYLMDTMRGFAYSNTALGLQAQSNQDESAMSSGANGVYPTATGFEDNGTFASNSTFIYIAIRRGPMKVPTVGTSVFAPVAVTNSVGTDNTAGFPVDLQINSLRSAGGKYPVDRLRGVSTTTTSTGIYLNTTNSNAESSGGVMTRNWGNTGFQTSDEYGSLSTIYWNFRRAPGFFDEVCYTGTGSATTVTHNLGVAPEFIQVKCRSNANGWMGYSAPTGNTKYINFADVDSAQVSSTSWNNTSPTSSVFTVGTDNSVNGSARTYVAYLFATVAGVSKFGSYTGTGTTQVINCGFTAGARFVMIKRTDSTGGWYVWDSARGIVAGNDPFLLLNSTAAEDTSTDYVDTASSGFEISSTAPAAINANGGSFIFLAIA